MASSTPLLGDQSAAMENGHVRHLPAAIGSKFRRAETADYSAPLEKLKDEGRVSVCSTCVLVLVTGKSCGEGLCWRYDSIGRNSRCMHAQQTDQVLQGLLSASCLVSILGFLYAWVLF